MTDDELDNKPVTDEEFAEFMKPTNFDNSTCEEPVNFSITKIIDGDSNEQQYTKVN